MTMSKENLISLAEETAPLLNSGEEPVSSEKAKLVGALLDKMVDYAKELEDENAFYEDVFEALLSKDVGAFIDSTATDTTVIVLKTSALSDYRAAYVRNR
jgi:hypothetical protein